MNDLPPELRERILFVQSAEGSTGDGQPYKGNPLEAQYDISNEVWNDFRLETWKRYRNAVPGIPILVNSDANGGQETEWLLENMDVIALKHGMFSHGYHVSDNSERLAKFHALEAEAKKRGKPVLTRGEMDGEMFVMGWSTRNIPQALYWSGLFATHCGLDIWNIPHKALKDEANLPAFEFFNKYAGHTDPGHRARRLLRPARRTGCLGFRAFSGRRVWRQARQENATWNAISKLPKPMPNTAPAWTIRRRRSAAA